jgi:hypothetical protein
LRGCHVGLKPFTKKCLFSFKVEEVNKPAKDKKKSMPVQKDSFNFKLLERKALAVCGLGNQVSILKTNYCADSSKKLDCF